MPGARRRGRPRTAWMDNIKTWTGLSVEESVRMTEDRDKWRKVRPWCGQPSDRGRLRNRTEHIDATCLRSPSLPIPPTLASTITFSRAPAAAVQPGIRQIYDVSTASLIARTYRIALFVVAGFNFHPAPPADDNGWRRAR